MAMFSGTREEQREQVIAALKNTNEQMQRAFRYRYADAMRDCPHDLKNLGLLFIKRRLVHNLDQANIRLVNELTALDASEQTI